MASFSSPNSLPLFTSQAPKPTAPISNPSSPPALACPEPAARSLYDVLGVPATATRREIKSAYRRLAQASHPDVAAACVDQRQNQNHSISSSEEFVRINAAYATLYDPGKRADYDREVFKRRWTVKAVTLSSQSRYESRSCRNWETDQCW